MPLESSRAPVSGGVSKYQPLSESRSTAFYERPFSAHLPHAAFRAVVRSNSSGLR